MPRSGVQERQASVARGDLRLPGFVAGAVQEFGYPLKMPVGSIAGVVGRRVFGDHECPVAGEGKKRFGRKSVPEVIATGAV